MSRVAGFGKLNYRGWIGIKGYRLVKDDEVFATSGQWLEWLNWVGILWALCLVLALSTFPISGVASDSAGRVYQGEYFYNFENARFTPAGSGECWALLGDMSKAEVSRQDGSPPSGTSYVTIRGTLGPAGHFGNLGVCTHELVVIEVLKAEKKTWR